MKTTLGAFAALLLSGALCIPPAHAQVQVQPGPGFSVQIGGSASAAGTAARGVARARRLLRLGIGRAAGGTMAGRA